MLASIDLVDKAGEEHVRRLVQEIIRFREVREAYEAARLLAEQLKGKRDLEVRYAPHLATLKAASLPLLTDEGAMTVFADFLPVVLGENDVDLVQGLRQRVIGMPMDQRRSFFATIVQQLSAAQVSLTREPLTLANGSIRPPTLGNWVQAIRERLEKGTVVALLESPFITNLPDDEEARVRRLIHVIDLARREATGELVTDELVIRDADGTVRVLSEGEIIPLAGGRKAPTAKIPPPPAASLPRPAPAVPPAPAPVAQPAAPPKPVRPAPVRVQMPSPPVQRVAGPVPSAPMVPKPAAPVEPVSAPVSPIAQTQYSLEDEEEIQKQTERLRDLETEPSADAILDTRMDEFIREQNLSFTDENMRRRFVLTMKTYIKGIRNGVETEEVLARPEKIGGLGYVPATVSAIMAAAEGLIAQRGHHAGVRALVEEAKRQEMPGGIPEVPEVPMPATQMPAPPPVPVVEEAPQPASPLQTGAAPAPERPAPAHVEFTREPEQQSRPFRLTFAAKKPSLADITAPKKKLAGPSEEIRSMTLADFHKFGGTPKDRVQKLYSRFVALGKESFALRMEGIKAWRESPVYRLYLDVGSESLNTAKPVAEVIARRAAQGVETITEEEFHFIADLNRQLQFA